jgi:phenylalanyl-tRNA synthetase beta chain
MKLAGVVFGVRDEQNWFCKETASDFFDIKGAVEILFSRLSLSAEFKQGTDVGCIHPSISATVSIDGVKAGFVGQIHPELQQRLGLEKPLYCFELDLASFTGRPPKRRGSLRNCQSFRQSGAIFLF